MPARSRDDVASGSERVGTADSGETVTLARTVATKENGEGLSATYRLRSDADRPMWADVVDLLPSRWDAVEFVGAHPDFEPVESSASDMRILFRAEVPPDGDCTVKYGLRLGEAVTRSDMLVLRNSRFPLFEAVEPFGVDDGPGATSDSPSVRGPRRDVPQALRSEESFRAAKRRLFGDAAVDRDREGR